MARRGFALRGFALVSGLGLAMLGSAGFVPGLVTLPVGATVESLRTADGYLVGLFPVNTPLSLVQLAIGLWGIISSRSAGATRFYARRLAVLCTVLSVMGLFPGLNTAFGLLPLHDHNIWLHAVLALVAAFYGWAVEREADTRPGGASS